MATATALMASIWFTLLKVAFILFLAVGLFILAVLGLVLLSPARYKIHAEKYDVIKAEGNVSWLFGIIRVLLLYDDGKQSYNIKIFGIDLKKFTQKKSEEKIIEDVDYYWEGEEHEEKNIIKGIEEKACERKDDKTSFKEDKKSKEVEKDSKDGKQDSRKKNSKKTSSSHKSRKKKEEKNGTRQKISKIKEFIFEEDTKCIAGAAKKGLLRLLLKIKPRKIKSDILFGTGDACLTGQACGAIAACMAVTGIILNITPDFDNKVLRGRLEISGYIRALSVLFAVLKIILNRKWKSFYRNAKKIKEEL